MNKKDREELQDLFASKAQEKESRLRDSYTDSTDWFSLAVDKAGVTLQYNTVLSKEKDMDEASKQFNLAFEELRQSLISSGQKQPPNYLQYVQRSFQARADELKEKSFEESETGKKIRILRDLVKENRTQLIFVDQPSEVKQMFMRFQEALENI